MAENQPFDPMAASLATENKQSILQEELKLLQDKKMDLKSANLKYMAEHPELGRQLDDFVSAVYKAKPEDVVLFGEKFFHDLAEKDRRRKLDEIERQAEEQRRAEEEAMQALEAKFPRPLVVAGPSGVGKGTLEGMLMQRYPEHFGFSISHTTRQPRPAEQEGVHYYFVDDATMQEAIKANKFVEHAYVHTNYYGTSYEAVENIQQSGKICILDIDIQGVENIKTSNFKCRYLFISPPSIDVLEARLRARSTESEEKLQIRLKNARGEIGYGMTEGNFDAVVVNDDLEDAFAEIMELIMQWYPAKNIEFDDQISAGGGDGGGEDGELLGADDASERSEDQEA